MVDGSSIVVSQLTGSFNPSTVAYTKMGDDEANKVTRNLRVHDSIYLPFYPCPVPRRNVLYE